MQRSVGCGEQMAKMTMVDLDNRLGIKDPMHRKKLFLAMSARQVNITLTLKDLMTSFLFLIHPHIPAFLSRRERDTEVLHSTEVAYLL